VIEKVLARAKALPTSDLPWRLWRCWQAELSLKTGGEPRGEMAILVADLC